MSPLVQVCAVGIKPHQRCFSLQMFQVYNTVLRSMAGDGRVPVWGGADAGKDVKGIFTAVLRSHALMLLRFLQANMCVSRAQARSGQAYTLSTAG